MQLRHAITLSLTVLAAALVPVQQYAVHMATWAHVTLSVAVAAAAVLAAAFAVPGLPQLQAIASELSLDLPASDAATVPGVTVTEGPPPPAPAPAAPTLGGLL